MYILYVHMYNICTYYMFICTYYMFTCTSQMLFEAFERVTVTSNGRFTRIRKESVSPGHFFLNV